MGKYEQQLAESVRAACLRAAVSAYEQGGISGLCAEGRWELALDAVKSLDVTTIIGGFRPQRGPGADRE